MKNVAPLSNGFLVASMVGFLISAIWLYDYSKTWAFTFATFFSLMFVASVISLTYSDVDEKLRIEIERKYKR